MFLTTQLRDHLFHDNILKNLLIFPMMKTFYLKISPSMVQMDFSDHGVNVTQFA